MLWRRDVRHKDEAPNRYNVSADFIPLSSRRKGRKRRAVRAAEPCGNMSFVHAFMLAYDGNLSLLEINLCRKGSSLFSASAATKKMRTTFRGSHFFAVAEAEGFEPPWACTQTVFKTASL